MPISRFEFFKVKQNKSQQHSTLVEKDSQIFLNTIKINSGDRGATLKLGGGGFFLLILYNFKNIGRGRGARAPHPTPLSLRLTLQQLS